MGRASCCEPMGKLRTETMFRNVYCGKCRTAIGIVADGEYLAPIYCLECEAAVMAEADERRRNAEEYRLSLDKISQGR